MFMLRISSIKRLAILLLLLTGACHQNPGEPSTARTSSLEIFGEAHYIDGYPARLENGDINAVIEIPAGSIQKWEVDKQDGILKWERVGEKPRKIQYLGYPANYGMIPGTILSESLGGDGDPLDVIILGPPVERGKVVRCKVIGVLYLMDRGESDDKLIAVTPGNAFSDINSLPELDETYPGVKDILLTWFSHYKGPGKIISNGFGEKDEATSILEAAIEAYEKQAGMR
jgi:inorganic pyrophosphatase